MLLKQLLKSKIHQARVTYANPEYVGSIEVDGEVLRRVGIEDGELVHVWAVDHTSRIQTYAFSGPKGVVGMNGGAAHFFKPGDRIVIAAFALTDEKVVPKVVILDEENSVVRELEPFTVLG
jgi:aspartate 1-decarboxylase